MKQQHGKHVPQQNSMTVQRESGRRVATSPRQQCKCCIIWNYFIWIVGFIFNTCLLLMFDAINFNVKAMNQIWAFWKMQRCEKKRDWEQTLLQHLNNRLGYFWVTFIFVGEFVCIWTTQMDSKSHNCYRLTIDASWILTKEIWQTINKNIDDASMRISTYQFIWQIIEHGQENR